MAQLKRLVRRSTPGDENRRWFGGATSTSPIASLCERIKAEGNTAREVGVGT